MTVAQEDIIWTDPSDGYTIRVVRYPYTVHTEELGYLMGFSFHTGELWTEIPGRDNPDDRPAKIHIGPLVKTHTRFPASLLERGFGSDTHYLLGRKQGGFPLRLGSRSAVDALLAELKSQWREYRRAIDPEYRIQGLRAIRRARKGRNRKRLAELRKTVSAGREVRPQGTLGRAPAHDLIGDRIHSGRAGAVLGSHRGGRRQSGRPVQKGR